MSELIVADCQNTYRALPPIVVDCSVLAALLFDEPERESAGRVLSGKSLLAPWLIDHEMISVALKKAAAGQANIAEHGLRSLAQLRITRHSTNTHAQWSLAKQQNLTSYDAAYLQLAIELNAPLVTYDKQLGNVARRILGGQPKRL